MKVKAFMIPTNTIEGNIYNIIYIIINMYEMNSNENSKTMVPYLDEII